MIILSNCLTDAADEGCRKVVASLVRRIKAASPETLVVSCGDDTPLSDRHISANKLMVSPQLEELLQQRKEPLLYLPSPAKMRSTAIRLFMLSRYAKWGLRVILPMEFPMDPLSRFLILASGAQVIALSRSTWETYRQALGDRAVYLQAGVDTRRFVPVSRERKAALREAYGIPVDKPVVLHVGHLRAGRGIGCMAGISEEFHGVLVVSTQTADERDAQLRELLEQRPNITIFDSYIPHIEELYQLADVYLFPVEQPGNCIDVPLSALEAAACGIPVAATGYGELRELLNQPGFCEIRDLRPEALNALLRKLSKEMKSPRESVLKYDWNLAVAQLLPDVQEEKEDANEET